MKKKFFFLFVTLIIIPASISVAQSNAFLDSLLAQEQASFGKACLLVLSAASLVKAEASEAEALQYLANANWGLSKKAEEPISLGELCYLLMRCFSLSGGLMYSLFPGPRYATRELEFRGLVFDYPIPTRLVSGLEVMQLTGRLLTYLEETKK